MQHKPRVSILINNYNYERFLGEAIDSALAQSYGPVEVVVVDDGSTDGSRDVAERYGDRILRVYKANGGQASAFNAGIAAASGEWIAFLDSDDTWMHDKVERCMAALRDRPDAVMLYHRVRPVDAQGRAVGEASPKRLLSGSIARLAVAAGGWWPYPPTSALVFSRAYLEKVGEVPREAFRICADSYLGLLAPFVGPVHGIPDVLANYRLHGSNNWNDASRLTEQRGAVVSHRDRYATQVAETNEALARLGVSDRVSLEDHWPYQRLRHVLGEHVSRFRLTRLALQFPGRSLPGRVREVGRLWTGALAK